MGMAAAGGYGRVLWLHGSGQTGEESRAQVAPYFAAPELASVRFSFPTAPTSSIPCYGTQNQTFIYTQNLFQIQGA
jgi:predicted peptidase